MNTDLDSWLKWITLVLALWGAGLSTFVAVREGRKDRRRVRVRCQPGAISDVFGPPKKAVVIEAVNVGHRPVTIVALGFRVSDEMEWQGPQSATGQFPLPKTLNDSESAAILYHWDHIVTQIQQARAANPKFRIERIFARDSESRNYQIRPPRFLKEIQAS